MKQIVEISRRSMCHEDEGVACGPASSTAIMTEIVVDVDGQHAPVWRMVNIPGSETHLSAVQTRLFAQ